METDINGILTRDEILNIAEGFWDDPIWKELVSQGREKEESVYLYTYQVFCDYQHQAAIEAVRAVRKANPYPANETYVFGHQFYNQVCDDILKALKAPEGGQEVEDLEDGED